MCVYVYTVIHIIVVQKEYRKVITKEALRLKLSNGTTKNISLLIYIIDVRIKICMYVCTCMHMACMYMYV